jgi:hypothetical protein
VFEEAIDMVLQDKMDQKVFEDLVAYASFRIQQQGGCNSVFGNFFT